MLNVLVCGSRHLNDTSIIDNALSLHLSNEIGTIIHGAARGADSLAARWARQHNWKTWAFPAEWEKYGKAAGPIRNANMLSTGKPDLVIAFLAKDSRGTKNMIALSRAANVKTLVIEI